MAVSREAVMEALFTLLQTMSVKGMKFNFSRRFYMWDKVAGSAMPYVILTKSKESYPARVASGLPPKRTMDLEINIYISTGKNQQAIPDQDVEKIMDALDVVMLPAPGSDVLTLGGLVDYCHIEGDAMLIPGDIDGVGHMMIPLKIVLP